MKTLQVNAVFDELTDIVKANIAFAQTIQGKTLSELNAQPAPEKWSVLQCLEHLNRYASFYHPEIAKQLPNLSPGEHYKPSWLGDYFAKSMLPSAKMKKMKTFKSKDPVASDLDLSVVEVFLQNQHRMLEYIRLAHGKDVGAVKCATTLGSWLKFKLGDTFRFVLNHELRHVEQAKRVLKG